MSEDKAERLVNLTVALLETRRPLTFAELRRRTGYYRQPDPESARRMFERDKDALRRLGVPIETRDVDLLGTEVGYTIERTDYELPDVDLEPDEVAALALALRVIDDPQARLAFGRVAARAPDPSPDPPAATAETARLELDAAVAAEFAEPLLERRSVTFDYAGPGGAATRHVRPHAVVYRRGRWYLAGHDTDRDAPRVFRLDRVVGPVRPTGPRGAFEVPADADSLARVGGDDRVDARIAVADEHRWEAEVRGGVADGTTADGRSVHRFRGSSPWQLAAWAAGLGADAEVLSPPDLRADVIERLRGAAGAGPTP